MSYDLAVWEGAPPKTNADAAKTFEALLAQHQEADGKRAPVRRCTGA